MTTTYFRLVRIYNDPVWGPQVLPWIKYGLIRCHRNRLRKAIFEMVGSGEQIDFGKIKNPSDIVMVEGDRLAPWDYRKTMPLPSDVPADIARSSEEKP